MKKPYHTKLRNEAEKETIFEIRVPDSFTVKVKDWRYSILMELAVAMANPEDFIE